MAKDPREYGYEGDMVISQLKSIMANAEKLMSMLKPETDLPEWVQLKITLAQDYVLTARDYMESEMTESVDDKFASTSYSTTRGKIVKTKSGSFIATNKSGSTKSFDDMNAAKKHADSGVDEDAVEKMNSHKRKYTEVSHNNKVLGRVYKTADSEFPYKTNRKKMGDRGIWVSKMHKSKEDAVKHLMSTAKTNEAVTPNQQTEACWSGYVARGMKNKGGRMVPNCVPAEAVTTEKPPFEGPYKKADKKPVTRSHLKSLTKAARETISKSKSKAK